PTRRVSGERVGRASSSGSGSGAGAVLDAPSQLRPEETAGQSGGGATGEVVALSGVSRGSSGAERIAGVAQSGVGPAAQSAGSETALSALSCQRVGSAL